MLKEKKKVIGLLKNRLGGKIMRKFVGLIVKIKKAKGTKKCVIKRKVKFDNYKNSVEATWE